MCVFIYLLTFCFVFHGGRRISIFSILDCLGLDDDIGDVLFCTSFGWISFSVMEVEGFDGKASFEFKL